MSRWTCLTRRAWRIDLVLNAVTGVALDERRLRSLIEVGRSVVAELDLEVVLRRVLEVARELTGARYAALGVVNDDRTGLERFITAGIDERTRAEIGDLPHGRGVLGLLIDDPRPLRLEDVSRHPRSYGFPAAHPPMRSFLGVPIVIRGRAFGNLYLTEKEGGAFDEADEQATVILAEWAAIAIDNAKSVAEDRLKGSIEASERERGRWARELHDETLQALGALRVVLSAALRQGSPETIEDAARQAVSELSNEIEGLRGLIAELRPAALDEIGLAAAIQGLAERIAATEGLAVDAELSFADRDERGRRFDPEVESTIYRLVQEALTNVAKHARAEHVRLRAVARDGQIEVAVQDDGVGFDPEAPHEGFGIRGMRERIAMAGGSLEIRSSPGSGVEVRATIPIGRKPLASASTAPA
jgi:signal transduction histidine kinase